ncbi:MAG: hypothetical protein LBU85_05985 [Treponema sp.]|nr:hypothetical protein [Treponema sp.]
MNETPPLVRLDLRTPLLYTEAPGLDAFGCPPPDEAGAEFIFCFELDPGQTQSIEPQPDNFLGRLVFSGRNVQNQGNRACKASLELPAGLYLFAQRRGVIGREECIALAIEQQKDGLWERLNPGNRLFLRFLYEDGSPVTQLFRPFIN